MSEEALATPSSSPVVQRDLVVIGASAGGVSSLQALVAGLPPEFPAPILVVLHVPSTGTSVLPQILARRGPLPAVFAADHMPLERGKIFVAPADHHMLVRDGHIRLSQGPRENGHRPAIDPLFRSAARAAGRRCIGVVMSGLLDDGAAGLQFIKAHGGATAVQDPEDSLFPSMPRAAMSMTEVDAVAPAAGLAEQLCRFIEETLMLDEAEPVGLQLHDGIGDRDRVEIEDPTETATLVSGPPTSLTCPECGGSLWQLDEENNIRFACHVGHAYTLPTLAEEQGRGLETTLWSAVRSLEERAEVQRRLGRRMSGSHELVYARRAAEAEQHARALRGILGNAGRLAAPASDDS